MLQKQQLSKKITQLINDLAIPFLGLFIYDWGVFFIGLFFLLDYLFGFLFLFKKDLFLKKHLLQERSQKSLLFALIAFVMVLILTLLAFRLVIPDFSLSSELWGFLTFTEFGISQGLVLLPLLLITTQLQYKMEFINQGKYALFTREELWGLTAKEGLIASVFLLFACALGAFVSLPQTFWIIAPALLISSYRFFLSKM